MIRDGVVVNDDRWLRYGVARNLATSNRSPCRTFFSRLLSSDHNSAHRQVGAGSVNYADLSGCHVALRQEVTTQTIGDLASIDAIVLPLGCRNSPQLQRVRHLYFFRMGKHVIINPTSEDRRFHGDRPGLGKSLDPGVQLTPGCSNRAFHVHTTSRVFHTIADRALVNSIRDVE